MSALWLGIGPIGKDFAEAAGAALFFLHGVEQAGEEFEACGVVVGGLGVWDLVRGIVGEDHAEVVGLHFAIGRAGLGSGSGRDLGQEFAGGVFGREIHLELMKGSLAAYAGQGFAILRRAFAAPGVGYAGLRHEVTFIGAVGKNAGGVLCRRSPWRWIGCRPPALLTPSFSRRR